MNCGIRFLQAKRNANPSQIQPPRYLQCSTCNTQQPFCDGWHAGQVDLASMSRHLFLWTLPFLNVQRLAMTRRKTQTQGPPKGIFEPTSIIHSAYLLNTLTGHTLLCLLPHTKDSAIPSIVGLNPLERESCLRSSLHIVRHFSSVSGSSFESIKEFIKKGNNHCLTSITPPPSKTVMMLPPTYRHIYETLNILQILPCLHMK